MPAAIAVLAILLHAASAAAQLNAYYQGTEWVKGTAYPATAQFSCEKGRVAMALKGAKALRILFLEKEDLLRIVDDTGQAYVDLEGGLQKGMASQMEKQMAKMPPEQREMARQMMESTVKQAKLPPPEYVWTDQKETIKGYECTRVDVMRGGEKRGDYWGTPSEDFKITKEEQASVVKMHESLDGSGIVVKEGGGGSRAFLWDSSRDGYPIRTHCYDHGTMTLELELVSSDRRAPPKELFEVPKGYKKGSF
jgi:hypothetical protein